MHFCAKFSPFLRCIQSIGGAAAPSPAPPLSPPLDVMSLFHCCLKCVQLLFMIKAPWPQHCISSSTNERFAINVNVFGKFRWLKIFFQNTWVHLVYIMYLFVTIQMIFPCKAFVTDCTQIGSWLVIMWMLSDIITISFNLYLKCHSCIYTTNQALSHNNETWYMH